MKHLFAVLVVALTTPLTASIGNASENQYPRRVVSMNLCTDQLAILIADPGQLVSVSYLSHDPHSSVLSDLARTIPANHGLAEELFMLKPDLVIAGQYSTRTTKDLLRRLGQNVVEIKPARDFESIRINIRRLGEILHQKERAETLIRAMDTELVLLKREQGKRPLIGSYGANSYSTGGDTLESTLVQTAGAKHLGTESGQLGTRKIPLEELIYLNPDYLLTWQRSSSQVPQSKATENLYHPALLKWFGQERQLTLYSKYWICGAPFSLEAIHQLKDAIKKVQP